MPYRRSTGRFFATLLLFALSSGTLLAQESLPPSLSLDEAIRIAQRHNPLLQADLNNTEVADWNIKAAYGALVPSASASSSFSWQGSGEQQVGSVTLTELGFGNQPSYYFSSYRLGLSYALDGRILMALPQAKADREAQVAQGNASAAQAVFRVTGAYLDVLRQQESLGRWHGRSCSERRGT